MVHILVHLPTFLTPIQLVIYPTAPTKYICLQFRGERMGGKDSQEVWDWHVHIAVF